LARRRQYQYDARRQQGDGGGVFGDSQFTSTLSVNFHFPKIPRRTYFFACTPDACLFFLSPPPFIGSPLFIGMNFIQNHLKLS
ncbi:hypothetical protein, partial [Aeromonas sp. QDB25]